MNRLRWLLPCAMVAVLAADAPEPEHWIRTHAIPLQTVEAGHGFDDLQPLAKVVGDARFVALGEATHGTREFFQLKHRLIEFLASQKGFTIFSIEANMPEAYRLNDFVLNGNGDPKQLLKGMYFWTWDTEEVLNMILWMREFNRSGKGRIEFTGFDMQTPNVAIDIVRSFVKEHDPSYLDALNLTYSEVLAVRKSSDKKLDKKQVSQDCANVVAELQVKRAALIESSRAWDVDWAIQNARILLQYMQMQTGDKSRDQSMAENIEWIAEQNPGAKIVLWAHNGHVAYAAQYGPMGSYLHKKFGSQLVAFGFAFNEGSFRAIEKGKSLRDFTVGPAAADSLDHALASVGIPLFALDLRQLPQEGPVAQWFAKPLASRSIGAVYGGGQPEEWSIASLHWPETFDVILFVEKTTAARGNP
jgi:erythromycin esterase